MIRGARSRSWGGRVGAMGAVAMLVAGAARAADGGRDGGGTEGGGEASCETSASCAFPTPYCSPYSHACVECTSDRNCARGLVCDVMLGICRDCRSDSDCSPDWPYCDPETHACVECVTDANCGVAGQTCRAGKCGSCGDGICGRHERIQASFGPGGSTTAVECPEDCAMLCPAHDLKSRLGTRLLEGSFATERPLLSSFCTSDDTLPDVTLSWTAPHDGNFFVSTGVDSSFAVTEWTGGCSDFGLMGVQCSLVEKGAPMGISLSKGDTITMILSPVDDPRTSYSLDITDKAPECDGGDCVPIVVSTPPAGGKDAGTTSLSSALCLDNARARHEDICAGTECACAHCPQDYDDCGVIPGCNDERACMKNKGCVGADCYISGQCRQIIDTYGGLAGPAFRAASGLQSCALSVGCELPCGDAGMPSADAGTDAGRSCAPGRAVACPCEGGVTGTKICDADGGGFGTCACDGPPPSPVSDHGGCNCALGAPAPTATEALWLGLALGLATRRRRARRDKEGT